MTKCRTYVEHLYMLTVKQKDLLDYLKSYYSEKMVFPTFDEMRYKLNIKSKSGIKLVRDILHDIGHREIRTVPQIGSFWATKIYQLAEEYIS